MRHSRILRFGLAVVGALAVAAAAIAVTASAAGVNFHLVGAAASTTKAATTTGPATGTGAEKAQLSAACAGFMKNFAANLNTTQDAVDAAAKKALGQTIDDSVASGQLTADQAAKIKAAIPAGSLCSAALSELGRGAGGPHHAQGPAKTGLGQYMDAYMEAAAKAAGLTGGAAELKTELAKGHGLGDIAKAHGVDEATLRGNMIANLTPSLDAAVKAGKLTAAQETAILDHLKTGPIPLWHVKRLPPGAPPATAPGAPPA